jgi:ribosomal protein L11 methyltransferase
MKRKSLWTFSVTTTPEAEDAIAEILGAILSRAAVSYHNLETGVSTVTVYSEAGPVAGIRKTIVTGLAQIKNCGLEIGSSKITIAKMRREDWSESWKRHFKPIEIGRALLLKPSWRKRRPRKNQALVILDPGLSFGTGQHPTTAFCLHEIVAAVSGRRNRRSQSAATVKSFLDIGTGSGILAIAAVKLGCRPVHAFDFDAEAVRVARTNARANRVQTRLTIGHGDVAKLPLHPVRQFDLICANLISDLLITERRRIVAQLSRGGTLVLAGILKSEFQEVEMAFEILGLKLVSTKSENEWQSGSFRRVKINLNIQAEDKV